MDHKEKLESFKQMLAQAMMLGIRLSEHAYSGLLQDAKNRPLLAGIDALQESVKKVLLMDSWQDVSADEILPLYREIQELSCNRELM